MLSGITIGQFFPGDSLLHRMDPRMKLVLTFGYIVAVFVPVSYTHLRPAGLRRSHHTRRDGFFYPAGVYL